MSEKSTMGVALRAMGPGPVEVMLRVHDWGHKDLGPQGVAFGQELVAFKALTFAEVRDDVWEFQLIEQDMAGDRKRLKLYLCGADLLMVRRPEE